MRYSEAKKHNQICSVFHLNLLLNFVLRLEKHLKQVVGTSAAWVGSGANDWTRGSERLVSEAISKIDTAVRETTDLRTKLVEQGQRLALLEGRVRTAKEIPMASNSAMLLPQNLPGDISRRLTNAENGSGNIEFLMGETVREINDVKQEVKDCLSFFLHIISLHINKRLTSPENLVTELCPKTVTFFLALILPTVTQLIWNAELISSFLVLTPNREWLILSCSFSLVTHSNVGVKSGSPGSVCRFSG